jgi:hypothetical protein
VTAPRPIVTSDGASFDDSARRSDLEPSEAEHDRPSNRPHHGCHPGGDQGSRKPSLIEISSKTQRSSMARRAPRRYTLLEMIVARSVGHVNLTSAEFKKALG